MKKAWDNGVCKTLITKEEIATKVKELGKIITEDYKNLEEEFIVVCLLKGSVLFMADLCREIKLPMKMDFMSVSSYGDAFESSKEVKIKKELDENIMGKHVIIIEDIIDTGRTLKKITEILKMREPKSIKICTLLDKPTRREVEVAVDYRGFVIPDEFVLGYGLDFKQEYRNLPEIVVMGSLNEAVED
ncbi:MAG: hypoxanthine phosphoribosyltransferase [Fusobacteriaceae bacterium]